MYALHVCIFGGNKDIYIYIPSDGVSRQIMCTRYKVLEPPGG